MSRPFARFAEVDFWKQSFGSSLSEASFGSKQRLVAKCLRRLALFKGEILHGGSIHGHLIATILIRESADENSSWASVPARQSYRRLLLKRLPEMETSGSCRHSLASDLIVGYQFGCLSQ